jgi:hypothetical protein
MVSINSTTLTWIVIAALALVMTGVVDNPFGGNDSVVAQDSSSTAGKVILSSEISSITSGVADLSTKGSGELQFDSADLNSANTTNISFTYTGNRIDELRANDGDLLSKNLYYHVEAYDFFNQVDASDNTRYFTVEFANNDDQFYIWVDGTGFAASEEQEGTILDTTDGSNPASAVVTFQVEDYISLDKASSETVADIPVGKFWVTDNQGNVYDEVEFVYRKD